MPNNEIKTTEGLPEVKPKKEFKKGVEKDTPGPVVTPADRLLFNSAGILIKRNGIELTNYELFIEIQKHIKVNKSKYNAFAKFHFRNVEDIYEAWKKLDVPLALKLSDTILEMGPEGKLIMESTAEIKDKLGVVVEFAKAHAIIGEGKAGMSTEQATGSASSYARKYALNGLLLLDDNKDVDEADLAGKKGKSTKPPVEAKLEEETKKIKIKELQDAIRGNKVKTDKASKALAGRSLLKLTLNEITEIINVVNAK